MSNVPNPFLEYNLRLKADRINGFEKDPTLAVAVGKNNVSLTCYPGSKDSEGRQVNIRAGMDSITFSAVIAAVRRAVDAEPGYKFPVRCYTPRKRQPGEQGRPKILAATVVVGKDQNGCVFISVVRKDPPHVKFIFRPSEYHQIMKADNQTEEDLAEVSKIYAIAWADNISDLARHVLANDVHDWRAEKDGQNGGNGGGNYNGGGRGGNGGGNYNNRGGNGGGGGQQQSNNYDDSGFDADIPI